MHTLSDGAMVYFWFSGVATGASIAVLVIRVMSLPQRGQHSKTEAMMSVLNQFPGEIVSHSGKNGHDGLTRDERLMLIGDHAVALIELIDARIEAEIAACDPIPF